MRALALGSLFIIVSLAGCADQPLETMDSAPVPSALLGADVVPLDSNRSTSWFTGSLVGSELAGFPFSVPASALVSTELLPGFSIEGVFLEISVTTAGSLEQWAVYAFDLSGAQAVPIGSVVSTPGQYEGFDTLPDGDLTTYEAYQGPTLMYLADDAAGSDIGFVLVAIGASDEVSFSWAVLDEYPRWEDYDIPDDHRDFVQRRDGPAGLVESIGTGDGFSYNAYRELFVGFTAAPIGTYGYIVQNGEVEHGEGLDTWFTPYGGVRQTQLTVEGQTDGWASGLALYWPGNGGGSFDVDLSMYGTSTQDSGVAGDTMAPASAGMQPLMIAAAMGEGSGDASVRLDLTAADSNDFFILDVVIESFGASLEELLGRPAASESFSWPGLIVPTESGTLRFNEAPALQLHPHA